MSQIKEVKVKCAGGDYSILIGRGLLKKIGELARPVLRPGAHILLVTNQQVAGFFWLRVVSSLRGAGFLVESGRFRQQTEEGPYALPNGNETDKSVENLMLLWKRMAEIPLERSSALVALGGGVVGDITAFAASTYMRGISVIQAPTTLLAQVDSSIGGKTAVNLPDAKNVLGTFHQPKLVVADIEALGSLPVEEFASQFAEVIKYGVIADPALFELLEKKLPAFFAARQKGFLEDPEYDFLEEIVYRSAAVKADVVSKDEKESGLRMILNYGHTFAHGFESASQYRLPHGNAVALGMLCAGRMAVIKGLWSKKEEERQKNLIGQLPGLKTLKALGLNLDSIMRGMASDKKKKDGRLQFVLPVRIGEVKVVNDISEETIRKVIEEMTSEGDKT